MSQSHSRFEPIALSQDQRADALREITDLSHGLAVLADALSKGYPLQPELTRNILYIVEAGLANLAQITGIDIESAQRRAERYMLLRKANERIRDLEQVLGAEVSTAQTQLAVERLLKRARQWWRTYGLGHISEIRVEEQGHVEMKLSCHLFGDFRLSDSATPLSHKGPREQWRNTIRDKGFVLNDEDEDSDTIVDCEGSRQALIRLVTTAMPSAKVCSITNHVGPRGPKLLLVDALVFVPKLSDLEALPQ